MITEVGVGVDNANEDDANEDDSNDDDAAENDEVAADEADIAKVVAPAVPIVASRYASADIRNLPIPESQQPFEWSQQKSRSSFVTFWQLIRFVPPVFAPVWC